MTSEIRVNSLTNRSGLSTVSITDTGVVVAGVITATNFSGSATGLIETPDITVNNIQSGVVTATTFIGDGSGLTGVTASGSGINIKDNGSIVGVAATVDFSTNLNVSPASAGIVTVTVGDTDFEIADKIVHTGDTDTAIRFPAADIITAETGGSERLRITSAGNVGIGTDNPTATLNIKKDGLDQIGFRITSDTGSENRTFSIKTPSDDQQIKPFVITTSNALAFETSLGGTTKEVLRMDHNGEVGIGTNNPQSHLEVYEGTGSVYIKARAVTGDAVLNLHSPSDRQCEIWLRDDHGAGGKILYDHTDNYMAFFTQDTNQNFFDEKLRIAYSGNVGIGSQTPQAKLDVSGNLSLGESGGSDNTYIDQKQNGSLDIINSGRLSNDGRVRINNVNNISGDTTYFRDFEVYNGKGTLLLKTDGSSGRIGIGSDNPEKKLDIAGDVKIVETSPRLEFHDSNSSGLSNVTGGFETFDKSGNRATYVGAGMGNGGNIIEFGTNNTFRAIIDSDGNVGIGTNDPERLLSLRGSNAMIQLEGSGGNGKQWSIISSDDTTGSAAASGPGNFVIYDDIAGEDRLTLTGVGGSMGLGTNTPDYLLDVKTSVNQIARFETTTTSDLAIELKNSQGSIFYGLGGGEEFAVATTWNLNDASDNLFVIKQDGKVGINILSPDATLHVADIGSTIPCVLLSGGTDSEGDLAVPSNEDFNIGHWSGSSFNERVRLESGGVIHMQNSSAPTQVKFGTIDGSSFENREHQINVYGHSSSDYTLIRGCNTADGTPVFDAYVSGSRFIEIESNGDVHNATGTFTQISDAQFKENIVDSPSQWEDVKALKVRKFNFTEASGYQTHTQIGYVAQEVEQVSPGLIKTRYLYNEDGEEISGSDYKTVKVSLINVKAVKALQEAMARIEVLESRLNAAGIAT